MSLLLPRRVVVPELMDDPSLAAAEHLRALEGLRRINAWSGTAGSLWARLRPLAAGRATPLRVLDLACGGGDVTLALWRLARDAGAALTIEGADISETALARARAAADAAGAPVSFRRADLLGEPFPAGYDAAVSSLFLHHLSDGDAVRLLTAARGAVRHVVVSDLDRGGLGLAAAWVGTRVLSRSRVVHVDGPRSVRAAFTGAEAAGLARRAGLGGAKVDRGWPFRWVLSWSAA